jgi:hypothetical protein
LKSKSKAGRQYIPHDAGNDLKKKRKKEEEYKARYTQLLMKYMIQ